MSENGSHCLPRVLRRRALLPLSSKGKEAKRNWCHDHHHHLVACELAQCRSGRWQPQHVCNHEQKVLIVVIEFVFELMSHQVLEERATLVILLRLKKVSEVTTS